MIRYAKSIGYKILYFFWDKKQLNLLNKVSSFDKVFVIDIDNTLTISNIGSPINHIDPLPRLNMINYVNELINDNQKVIYLSARDFRLYDTTKKWLEKHKIFNTKENQIFLVESSISKIVYLKVLCNKNQNVIFIDDLSYNYENGIVKIYEETKAKLALLPLEYKGLDFIEG